MANAEIGEKALNEMYTFTASFPSSPMGMHTAVKK